MAEMSLQSLLLVFGGVECVGVGAGEVHGARVTGGWRRGWGRGEEVEGEGRKLGVVVLGCAGMVGMEGWGREEVGEGVRVVDGMRAAVGILQGLMRGGYQGGW